MTVQEEIDDLLKIIDSRTARVNELTDMLDDRNNQIRDLNIKVAYWRGIATQGER